MPDPAPVLVLRRRSPAERTAFREGARLALTMLAERLDCDRSELRLLRTDDVSREIRRVFSAIDTSEQADAEPSDAYQRGRRDSLLDAAAQCDQLADVYEGIARKTLKWRGYNYRNPFHYGVFVRALGQAMVLREARDFCRSLAERCPQEPTDAH